MIFSCYCIYSVRNKKKQSLLCLDARNKKGVFDDHAVQYFFNIYISSFLTLFMVRELPQFVTCETAAWFFCI